MVYFEAGNKLTICIRHNILLLRRIVCYCYHSSSVCCRFHGDTRAVSKVVRNVVTSTEK